MLMSLYGGRESIEVADQPIGAFDNQWRNRIVRIFAHPTDATKVVTEGRGYNGGISTNLIEDRTEYERFIGRFNGVAK